jgi:hypothetical protein
MGQVEQRVKTPPGVLPIKADTSGIKNDTTVIAQDTVKRPADSTVVQAPRGDYRDYNQLFGQRFDQGHV